MGHEKRTQEVFEKGTNSPVESGVKTWMMSEAPTWSSRLARFAAGALLAGQAFRLGTVSALAGGHDPGVSSKGVTFTGVDINKGNVKKLT